MRLRARRPGHAGGLLLVGDGFSAFGNWIDFLAILTVAAYQFHVTPYGMALVSAAGLLPGMLCGPAIGRWCDRGDARRLLLASTVLRVLATGAILACHSVVLFLPLVALRSVFATVAVPAINVLAARTVAVAGRPRFYSLLNVVNSTAKVVAPALGTVAGSLAGDSVALLLSAGCSAAACGVFALLRVPPQAAAAAGPAPAAAAPLLPAGPAGALPLLWIGSTCAFAVFMVNNLVPLVLQQAGQDKALLGILVACSGAGNIAAGLWLARQGAAARLTGRLRETVLPALLQAACFGVMGLLLWAPGPRTPWLLAAAFAVVGSFSARFAIALNVHLSLRHAADVGAVSGRLQAWQSSMIFIAPMAGAWVLDTLGGAALFGCSTAVALLSFALLRLVLRLAAPRALKPAAPPPAGCDAPPGAAGPA